MVLAVKSWVFNPELEGSFVKVYGIDSNGDSIHVEGKVNDLQGDRFSLIRFTAQPEKNESVFHLSEFGENGLKLDVLTETVRCEIPKEIDQTLW